MNSFQFNDRVYIKTTTTDLSFWLRQARDNGTQMVVIATDECGTGFNVKVEYRTEDGERRTGLFRDCELERRPNHRIPVTPAEQTWLDARRTQIAEHGYSCTAQDIAAAAAAGIVLNVPQWGRTSW